MTGVTDTTQAALLAAAAPLKDALGGRDGPVGVLLDAGHDHLRVVLAAMAVGRPFCSCHSDWALPELTAALEDADVTTLVTSRRLHDRLPELRSIESLTIDDLPSRGPQPVDIGLLDPDARFYIGFTSGSSGRPKPFTRAWRSWRDSFEVAADLYGIAAHSSVALPGQMQHSHFLFGALLALDRGAALRLYERFDAAALLADLAAGEADIVYLVPTMLSALGLAATDRYVGTAVRTLVVSGAKLEPHHWCTAQRLFPQATVRELYGSSETSFITVGTGVSDHDDGGYVGLPFPGVDIELRPLGDADRPAAAPRTGVVWVRSPYLFAGYLRAGATPDDGLDERGFMTVGDVGRLREDGGLSLVGRVSNMIISGGKNVHPEEIEQTLIAHPDVADCAITAVPDEYWGELIVALVVPTDAACGALDERGLTDYLRVRLAAHKLPKRWISVGNLPLTASGKVARAELPALAAVTAAVPIDLDDVRLSHDDREIIAGIDLRLRQRRVALIGRNGSGKSSLLQLIGGLKTPSSGTLSVDRLDCSRQARELRGQVGFVFQNPETQLVLPTVAEDLTLGFSKRDRKSGLAAARAQAVLERLGIADLKARYCHELSGGEQQLVALAGALVREPRVLLFDEPTTFLDLFYAGRLRAILSELTQTLLIATHDLALAADCERVIVLAAGQVAFDGPPQAAIAHYRELARWT